MVKLVALLISVVQYKNDSASQLNNNLDKVNYWAYAWKMFFNPDPLKQAQAVIFFRKPTKDNHPSIYFYDIPVTQITIQKHTGFPLVGGEGCWWIASKKLTCPPMPPPSTVFPPKYWFCNFDAVFDHFLQIASPLHKLTPFGKLYIGRYFRSIWTVIYQFWTHPTGTPKLNKPGKNFLVKVNIDISCKYFSFLAYQRTVQLLYEILDTLIADLTFFTVRQS